MERLIKGRPFKACLPYSRHLGATICLCFINQAQRNPIPSKVIIPLVRNREWKARGTGEQLDFSNGDGPIIVSEGWHIPGKSKGVRVVGIQDGGAVISPGGCGNCHQNVDNRPHPALRSSGVSKVVTPPVVSPNHRVGAGESLNIRKPLKPMTTRP